MKEINFKLFFKITLIAFVIFSTRVFSPVWARESNNIVGVNLACQWQITSPQEVTKLVRPGGWMVVMATPGDAAGLQALLNQNPEVNLIIRTDKLKQSYSPADAAAWVATLGKLQTSQRLFVIPWNEPNQDLGGNLWLEAQDLNGQPLDVVVQKVKDYAFAFSDYLDQSGLRSSGKVFLLSPMLNQSHWNYGEFIQKLGGKDFYDKFDGIALNLYDFRSSTADKPTENEVHLNAARYRELLGGLNVSPTKPVFAVETGVVAAGDVRYDDNLVSQTIQAAVENNRFQEWKNDDNFDMFAVFSYDPENQETWDIFSAYNTRNYFQDLGNRLGGQVIRGGEPTNFNGWLQSQTGIVSCPDKIGYASNADLCQSRCGFAPGTSPITLSYAKGQGDHITQHQSVNDRYDQVPDLPIPLPPIPPKYIKVWKDSHFDVNGAIKPSQNLRIPDLSDIFRNLEEAENVLLPLFFKQPAQQKELLQIVYPPEQETVELQVQYPLCSLGPKPSRRTEVKTNGIVTARTQPGYLTFIARSLFWCGILGGCDPLNINTENPQPIEFILSPPAELKTAGCRVAQGVEVPDIERPVRNQTKLAGDLFTPACYDHDQETVDFKVANQPITFFPGSIEAANYYFNSSWVIPGQTSDQSNIHSGLLNFARPAALRYPNPDDPTEANAKIATQHDISLSPTASVTENVNLEWKPFAAIRKAYEIFQCNLISKATQEENGMDCQPLAGPSTGPIQCQAKPQNVQPCAGNLLTNGNFEDGFSERGAGEVVVANGWEPWYIQWQPDPTDKSTWGYNYRPEYKPEDGQVFGFCRIVTPPDQGHLAQKFFTTFATHTAGFYQTVPVEQGKTYTFSTWIMTWSSNQDNPNVSSEPGNYRTGVGIDPHGGTDPNAASIIWSDEVVGHDNWVNLEVTAKALSPQITVFTKGQPEYRVKHNDSYWDEACLLPAGGGGAYCDS